MTPVSNKLRPASCALKAPQASPPLGIGYEGSGAKYRICITKWTDDPNPVTHPTIAIPQLSRGIVNSEFGPDIHGLDRNISFNGVDFVLANVEKPSLSWRKEVISE